MTMSLRRFLVVFLTTCALSAVLIAISLPPIRDAAHDVGSPAAAGPEPRTRRGAVRASGHIYAGVREPGRGALVSVLIIEWAIVWPLSAGLLVGVPIRGRLRARRRRRYERYPIVLSHHDECHSEELEGMVEVLGGVVREFVENWWRHGQPFLAFELFHGPTDTGMGLTLCVLCEPRHAEHIDAAISAAYPNVRLGQDRVGGGPQPLRGRIEIPGFVLRMRKHRSFVLPISRDQQIAPRPMWEEIAAAMIRLDRPCAVRIYLWPARRSVERLARRRTRRLERELNGGEGWGSAQPGSHSPLGREELANVAARVQNHSLFWAEIQVAAADREDARIIAAALGAKRAENYLRRRYMLVRQGLYRRRFPLARPPLAPTPIGKLPTLMSTPEIADLIRLPSGRLDRPFERRALPRTAAAPELRRSEPPGTIELPPDADQPRG